MTAIQWLKHSDNVSSNECTTHSKDYCEQYCEIWTTIMESIEKANGEDSFMVDNLMEQVKVDLEAAGLTVIDSGAGVFTIYYGKSVE